LLLLEIPATASEKLTLVLVPAALVAVILIGVAALGVVVVPVIWPLKVSADTDRLRPAGRVPDVTMNAVKGGLVATTLIGVIVPIASTEFAGVVTTGIAFGWIVNTTGIDPVFPPELVAPNVTVVIPLVPAAGVPEITLFAKLSPVGSVPPTTE
jgi:hypothetical protein